MNLMGKFKVVSDFLPSPEELALKDETVKVTIALSKTSVDFFKKQAKKLPDCWLHQCVT